MQSTGLPKIPGYSFYNPTLTKYHKTSHFRYVNGCPVTLLNRPGVGGTERDISSIGLLPKPEVTWYHPYSTYGRARNYVPPIKYPHEVYYDKQALCFSAFFKQTDSYNRGAENYQIRHVFIYCYLEDNTIKITEPKINNSGITQGVFLSRQRVPKLPDGEYYNWKDFAVGRDMHMLGRSFHIVDADVFTRQYMQTQGIPLGPGEAIPPDPYTQMYLNKQIPQRKTPMVDDKLRRLLEYNGMILKFDCLRDDRESECGEMREHILYYNLEDDTISVKEVRKRNDGRDPFPFIFRRHKAPKNLPNDYPAILSEITDNDVNDFLSPQDFLIGNTVSILGKRFLLTDCDAFTRKYYKEALKIEQKPRLDTSPPPIAPAQTSVPPHVSKLGSIEDTIQLYFRLIPKPPQRDEIKYVLNANKYLRYSAVLVSAHPEDQIRKFIILYSLSDSKIRIQETVIENSGIWGGKFLNQQLVEKPGSDPNWPSYYTPNDFYIGATIDIYKHKFRITGADLYVYKYIVENKDKFSPEVLTNIRNYMYQRGYLNDDIKDEEKTIERNKRDKELFSEIETPKPIPNLANVCRESIAKACRDTKIISKRDETINTDYGPITTRNENYYKDASPGTRYGISKPRLNCITPTYISNSEYLPMAPIAEIAKNEDSKEYPCCMVDTCPDKIKTFQETKDPKELSKLYYDNLITKHYKICEEAKKYYCLPCSKKIPCETKEPNEELKELEEQSQRKVVTFAENPTDPCAYNENDLCELNFEKRPISCTVYNKA